MNIPVDIQYLNSLLFDACRKDMNYEHLGLSADVAAIISSFSDSSKILQELKIPLIQAKHSGIKFWRTILSFEASDTENQTLLTSSPASQINKTFINILHPWALYDRALAEAIFCVDKDVSLLLSNATLAEIDRIAGQKESIFKVIGSDDKRLWQELSMEGAAKTSAINIYLTMQLGRH